MAYERVSDGLILHTRCASALRLMLGAMHHVALRSTLAEQSSQTRLQAGLADSLSVDYLAPATTRRFKCPLLLQLKRQASNSQRELQ